MGKKWRTMALTALMLLSSATASADDDGAIRVLLASLGSPKQLTVAATGDYMLGSAVIASGAKLTLTAQDGEIWLASGDLLLNLGETATLRRADGGLNLGENGLYVGDLTVTIDGDALVPILTMDIEEYLLGVVGSEMSDSFPLEALKAQAVAARSYALRRKSERAAGAWDVRDTAADQVFKGYNPEFTHVAAAVEATRGVVGTVNGAYAACYFTASNGGQIARPRDVWGGEDDGAIELRDDPYDVENPRSLVNALTFAADLSDCAALRKMLTAASGGADILRVTSIAPAEPEFEGSKRFLSLDFSLETADGSATVRLSVYDDIKDGLSLGLNGGDHELISVTQGDGTFTLSMRRFGHGVGMSQRGAQWMAAEYGMTWEKILSYYYPNMELAALTLKSPEAAALPDAAAKLLPDRAVTATVKLPDASSRLNLRSEPSTDAEILMTLANDTPIELLTTENGWCRVRIKGSIGWCKEEYIMR